ncbi:hypothetical protein ACN9JG_05870 [Cereibacter azotoformans]|uniref:hypothetical protein n=1 Tax=Cereibacter azotoformans TaxID=43057 RepID=UPI003B21F5C5
MVMPKCPVETGASSDPLPAPEAVQPEAAAEATPETATFHFGPHALRVMMLDPTS